MPRQSENIHARALGNQKRDKQEAQAIRRETSKRPRQSEKRRAKGPRTSKETIKESGLSEKRQTTCPPVRRGKLETKLIRKETIKGSSLSEKRQTTCPVNQKRQARGQANQKRDKQGPGNQNNRF